MSLLTEELTEGLTVDLLICKKGGTENYKDGKIVQETNKAILVHFIQANKKCWISKRIVNKTKTGSNYFAKALMWKPYARVKMEVLDITV